VPEDPVLPPESSVPPLEGSVPPPESSVPPPEGFVPPLEGSVPPLEGSVPPPEKSLVQLVVSEVRAAVPMSPGQEAGLAVLAEPDEPFRSLYIYIGQAEARAIQSGQRGVQPPRPSTWDLFLSAVELLGGKLGDAVINAVEESRHFYAYLEVLRGDQVDQLQCRPSDALALVVRSPDSSLYATEAVMAAAGRLPELPTI
jgi:bifunctional DNase/RNase